MPPPAPVVWLGAQGHHVSQGGYVADSGVHNSRTSTRSLDVNVLAAASGSAVLTASGGEASQAYPPQLRTIQVP